MGGKDIDQKIIGWIINEFKKDTGKDISNDPLALQRLDESAEKAKIELSTSNETEINIPFITSDENGPVHLALKLSRAKLEELAEEYITRSIEITKRALEASPFGISDIDEIILVGGQTRMPKIQEEVKKVFGKDPNKSINPDEVVALGAALQAGILQGDVKDVLLLDVIPLSLGIETMGGVATKLIERNTTIPATKSQTFSTAADNQTQVEINIVQGERAMATDNKSLGRFILDGIPPAPRGVPQVEVSFDIDANGILNVKAVDKASNKEQSIKIEASSGLSEEDIEKMKKDAEMNEDEDKKKKELIEAKNISEQTAYTAEKALGEAGDKVPEDTKKTIEDKIKEVREVASKDDLEAIKSKTAELSNEMQKIGEIMNQAAQQTQGAEGTKGAGPDENKDENIRDAEVEENKETEEGKDTEENEDNSDENK
jgi:molecular chaperone DnaK